MLSPLESTELGACQWPFDRRRLIFPYPGEGADEKKFYHYVDEE